MKDSTRQAIIAIVTNMVDEKLARSSAETEYKPFFDAIFSKSTIVQASLIQSFYTSFGMSVYEQIAVLLAKDAGYKATKQVHLAGRVDESTEALILRLTAQQPDKAKEMELIRASVQPVPAVVVDSERVVDVYVVRPDGLEMLFDITTVKPNLKEFRALRRKMLRWCALRFSQEPNAKVETYIGLPYNPYHPKPYKRWTGAENDPLELRVQEDLWVKFAGYDVFAEMIDVFREAGELMRERIEAYIRHL